MIECDYTIINTGLTTLLGVTECDLGGLGTGTKTGTEPGVKPGVDFPFPKQGGEKSRGGDRTIL